MARLGSVLALIASGALLLHRWSSQACFAQMNVRRLREEEGSEIKVSVADTDAIRMDGLTAREARLMTQLAAAAKARNWLSVQSLWASYSGTAFPVFCAAMQAAFKCGRYMKAAEMHDRLRRSSLNQTSPVPFTMGIKIFGKLEQHEKVDMLWAEAKQHGLVDEFVAGTFIDAAADAGNLYKAVEGLEYMLQHGHEVDATRFCSVINACKNSEEPNRHKAALYLFQQMLDRGLHPDVVTFSALVGAYQEAPLKTILGARRKMRELGVTPNIVFAEVYISAVLGRLEGDAKQVARMLQNVTKDRHEAAGTALQDFRACGVPLTRLCQHVEQALRRLN